MQEEKKVQGADKFLIYIEEFDFLKGISNEEMGIFIRALIEFVRTGEAPVLDEKLTFAFQFISAHIARDQKKYKEVTKKRSIAGKKGQEIKKKMKEESSSSKEGVSQYEMSFEGENASEENHVKKSQNEITSKEKEGNLKASLAEVIKETVKETLTTAVKEGVKEVVKETLGEDSRNKNMKNEATLGEASRNKVALGETKKTFKNEVALGEASESKAAFGKAVLSSKSEATLGSVLKVLQSEASDRKIFQSEDFALKSEKGVDNQAFARETVSGEAVKVSRNDVTSGEAVKVSRNDVISGEAGNVAQCVVDLTETAKISTPAMEHDNVIGGENFQGASIREVLERIIESKSVDKTKDKKESKEYVEASVNEKFEEFWECYPKKEDKSSAKKAFLSLNPSEEEFLSIMQALKKHKQTPEWVRENGRFIPRPSKWISCRRWEDKIENLSQVPVPFEDSFDTEEFYNAALKKSQRHWGTK